MSHDIRSVNREKIFVDYYGAPSAAVVTAKTGTSFWVWLVECVHTGRVWECSNEMDENTTSLTKKTCDVKLSLTKIDIQLKWELIRFQLLFIRYYWRGLSIAYRSRSLVCDTNTFYDYEWASILHTKHQHVLSFSHIELFEQKYQLLVCS